MNLQCLFWGHRWFDTVQEGRVVLEYSLRHDAIHFVHYQARICTSCWKHEANETGRDYLGDLEDLHGNYMGTPPLALPKSYPEPGLPMLNHAIPS